MLSTHGIIGETESTMGGRWVLQIDHLWTKPTGWADATLIGRELWSETGSSSPV